MILCTCCEHLLSPEANSCPNCGAPWPATGELPLWKKLKNNYFINVLICLFFFIVAAPTVGFLYSHPTNGGNFFLDYTWVEKVKFMLLGNFILFILFLLFGGSSLVSKTFSKNNIRLLIVMITILFIVLYIFVDGIGWMFSTMANPPSD